MLYIFYVVFALFFGSLENPLEYYVVFDRYDWNFHAKKSSPPNLFLNFPIHEKQARFPVHIYFQISHNINTLNTRATCCSCFIKYQNLLDNIYAGDGIRTHVPLRDGILSPMRSSLHEQFQVRLSRDIFRGVY